MPYKARRPVAATPAAVTGRARDPVAGVHDRHGDASVAMRTRIRRTRDHRPRRIGPSPVEGSVVRRARPGRTAGQPRPTQGRRPSEGAAPNTSAQARRDGRWPAGVRINPELRQPPLSCRGGDAGRDIPPPGDTLRQASRFGPGRGALRAEQADRFGPGSRTASRQAAGPPPAEQADRLPPSRRTASRRGRRRGEGRQRPATGVSVAGRQ
jgi:hypothetical protein